MFQLIFTEHRIYLLYSLKIICMITCTCNHITIQSPMDQDNPCLSHVVTPLQPYHSNCRFTCHPFSFYEEMNIYKNNKLKKKNFVFAEKTFDTIFPANKLAHFTEQFLNFSPVFHTYLRFHCRYHQYNQLQPLNFVNLNVQNYTKYSSNSK